MSTGRKERYGPEAYAAVIKDLTDGIQLASALGGPNRPGRTAFYQRLKEDAALAREYEAAMEIRACGYVDKLLEINEKLMQGKIDPASARAASENYKWIAAKSDGKRWGDRQTIEATGAGGKDLFPEKASLGDFELARLVAYIFHKAERAAVDRGDLVALPESSA
jgi:hypothetical protein